MDSINYHGSMTMDGRLPFIDVCKGMLMLLVILLHIPSAMGTVNPLWKTMQQMDYIYSSFFMPCFFVLTGYCSSFGRLNIRRWVRTLLIPALLLGLINSWLPLLLVGDFHLSTCLHFGAKHILVYGSIYWFISALFVDKIVIVLVMSVVQRSWLRWICFIALSVLGFILYRGTNDLSNVWCFKHAFCLLPFLYLGQNLRGVWCLKRLCLIAIVVYGIIIGGLRYWGVEVPRFTWTIICSPMQMPIWYLCATLGSLGMIGVAMLIRQNAVLEFMGKGSFVIYCLHTVFLVVCARLIDGTVLENLDRIESCLVFLSIFFGAVICSLGFVWLFNRPCLLWITGRAVR